MVLASACRAPSVVLAHGADRTVTPVGKRGPGGYGFAGEGAAPAVRGGAVPRVAHLAWFSRMVRCAREPRRVRGVVSERTREPRWVREDSGAGAATPVGARGLRGRRGNPGG